MKKKLLLIIACAFLTFELQAQTSSNTITLGSSGMTVRIETSTTTVTLTLTGPSNAWLAIGFGASNMANASDMFVWNSTSNRDYTASGGYSSPSPDSSQSWSITSDNVVSSTRTVIATRALTSAGDYTFTNTATSIPIIYALGNGTTLGSHSNRGSSTIARVLSNDEFSLAKAAVYPNPSNGYFTITANTSIKNVVIYTLTGSFVRTIQLNDAVTNEVEVEGLSSGIYLLELSNDTEKVWKKIVVE